MSVTFLVKFVYVVVLRLHASIQISIETFSNQFGGLDFLCHEGYMDNFNLIFVVSFGFGIVVCG
ncbi:MAG: hypothetical protein OSB44_03815 [Verrucomicrobiales bacterium]|nr:hypothetical protein [Verrucomicrobiales bacterium]